MRTILTDSIKIAAYNVKRGDLVAFPTETVYGIGANVFDEKAVSKIFKIKGRPADNPLIVHVASKKDIGILAKEITPSAKKIIKKFFPGPVTVILKKNEIVPDIVTASLDTIAIRMPSSKIARELIKLSGVPIAAPSANFSGSPSPTSFQHVMKDLSGKISCILVGPASKYGLESTVIDCTGKYPVILRPGSVTLEMLRKKIDKRIVFRKSTGRIKSPGQKYRHYAPKAKVKLISDYRLRIADSQSIKEAKVEKQKEAFIGLDKKYLNRFEVVKICKTIEDYAKNLFSFFRECDDNGVKIIYCQKVSEKGIGLAIMNRVKKAKHS